MSLSLSDLPSPEKPPISGKPRKSNEEKKTKKKNLQKPWQTPASHSLKNSKAESSPSLKIKKDLQKPWQNATQASLRISRTGQKIDPSTSWRELKNRAREIKEWAKSIQTEPNLKIPLPEFFYYRSQNHDSSKKH